MIATENKQHLIFHTTAARDDDPYELRSLLPNYVFTARKLQCCKTAMLEGAWHTHQHHAGRW